MFIDEQRQNIGSVNMIKRGDRPITSVASDCITEIYKRSHCDIKTAQISKKNRVFD